jgi:hypothetical protein
MSNRIRQDDKPEPRDDDEPAATDSQAKTIVASSHRVATKSGRLSGGRACALSARAARRAKETA